MACLLISAAYVVELQWHYKLPLNGSWPATFSKVATISWLAVGLLTADVIVEMVQRRRARRRESRASPSPEGGSRGCAPQVGTAGVARTGRHPPVA